LNSQKFELSKAGKKPLIRLEDTITGFENTIFWQEEGTDKKLGSGKGNSAGQHGSFLHLAELGRSRAQMVRGIFSFPPLLSPATPYRQKRR
jgi:hypothetical protein